MNIGPILMKNYVKVIHFILKWFAVHSIGQIYFFLWFIHLLEKIIPIQHLNLS